MSKKASKRQHKKSPSSQAETPSGRDNKVKVSNMSGMIVGVIAGLVIFSLSGSGVSENVEVKDVIFIVGAIAVITGISVLIRRLLPSPEEYAKKHPKKP